MKLFLVTMLFLVIGCGNSNSSGSSDEAGIAATIIGSWEVETILAGNHSIKVDKPDPRNPFLKLNSSDWTQLKIDEQNLTLISTNFVFYSAPKLPYKVIDKKIVTIDKKDFSLTDFIVHEYSKDKLVLEFSYDGESKSETRWVFKRINESNLATKVAQVINFKQNLAVHLEQDGSSVLDYKKETFGDSDYGKKGFHDYIGCSLNKDKSLEFNFQVFEVKEDSISTGGEKDNLSIRFKDLKPDLNGSVNTMESQSSVQITTQLNKNMYNNTFSDCRHKLSRDGAALSIHSICKDSKDAKIQFKGVCLLKHSVW